MLISERAPKEQQLSQKRITIGLPVRNGGPFVAASIEALLAQSYRHFHLLISDNASTDKTPDLLRIMASDPRVRVERQAHNIGAVANFNHVFVSTEAPLFMWATADDLFDRAYVDKCVAKLDRNPALAGCHAWVRLIDSNDRQIGLFHPPRGLDSARLRTRLRSYLLKLDEYAIFCVFRREVLSRTRLLTPTWGADFLLIWEILLLSPLGVVPEPLISFRRHRRRSPRETVADLQGRDRATVSRFIWLRLWREMWLATSTLTRRDRRVAIEELLLALLPVFVFAQVRRGIALDNGARGRSMLLDLPRSASLLLVLAILNPRRFARGVGAYFRGRAPGSD